MDFADLALEVIGVSASGVLAPGPMFIANMLYAARQGPRAGLKMAYGHTIVELAIIVLIAIGVFSASAILSGYKDAIGVSGGVAILGFAGLQVVSITKASIDGSLQLPPARDRLLRGFCCQRLIPFS
jgi:threonine/homoserine/homoserine lactone efflux protein